MCDRGYLFEDDPAQVLPIPDHTDPMPRSLSSTGARTAACRPLPGGSLTCPGQRPSGRGVSQVGHTWLPQLSWQCAAPLCPAPPLVPSEGTLVHVPLVEGWPEQQVCGLEGRLLSLTCPSFLRVLLLSATYGRRQGDGGKLCTGEQDGQRLVEGDCLVAGPLATSWEACAGQSSCQVETRPQNTTWPAGECSLPRRNEVNLTFSCVECHYWADWAGAGPDSSCVAAALLATSWAQPHQLAATSPADQKDLLAARLAKVLSPESHSLSDLAQRPTAGDQGSLCGLAALYQALEHSLLTTAQLRTYDHATMREAIVTALQSYPWAFTAEQQAHHLNGGQTNSMEDATLLHRFFKG